MIFRVGKDELLEATDGHLQRFEMIGPRPIHRILVEADIDPEEVAMLVDVMKRTRRIVETVGEEQALGWKEGVIEGIVIGVRAERAAQRRET